MYICIYVYMYICIYVTHTLQACLITCCEFDGLRSEVFDTTSSEQL